VPRAGGLISYSAGAIFRETAAYVDKLLKGAKPADLPVSFPSSKRDFLRTVTPALLTDGLRIEGGI